MFDAFQHGAEYAGWLIKGLLTFLIGMFGFSLKKMRNDIDDLQDELNEVKVSLPTNYITKQDLKDTEKRICEMIRRSE